MADSPLKSVPRLRFAMLIWLASMFGAVSVTVMILPQLSAEVTLPAPLWLIALASVLQSGLLLALATGWRSTHADGGVPRPAVRSSSGASSRPRRNMVSAPSWSLCRRAGRSRASNVHAVRPT